MATGPPKMHIFQKTFFFLGLYHKTVDLKLCSLKSIFLPHTAHSYFKHCIWQLQALYFTASSIAFDSFKHVFSRVVGLSGSLMTVQKLSSHHEIMGTDSKDLNAGWTRASPLKFGLENNVPREADIFGRPHDIYQLIFYSRDQMGLLAMSVKFVVFLNDYGSGKIFIVLE